MVGNDAEKEPIVLLIADATGAVVAYSGPWGDAQSKGATWLDMGGKAEARPALEPAHALSEGVAESLAKGVPVAFSAQARDTAGALHPVSGLAAPLSGVWLDHERGPSLQAASLCPRGAIPGAPRGLAIVLLRPQSPTDSTNSENQRAEIRQRIGEIAHELNRPLSAVLNYTELALAHPDLPPAVRSRLEMVVRSAEACRDVVHHSLEIAAAEPVAWELVDINAVVRRAAASLSHLPALSTVILRMTLDPDLAPVLGLSRDLESVVRNLLENAIEALSQAPPQGSRPRVEVKTERVNGSVRVIVRDNGPGLDPSVRESLFLPFVTTKRPVGGAGLGLAIVRRIVQRYGGRVSAESPPEGGAVFTVELPAGDVTTSAPLSAPPEVAAEKSERARRRRALLIDDDVATRRLLGAYLETLGYESTEVGDGEEGLAKAAAQEYDVIVCDVKMPSMSGVEFHRLLKKAFPERAARVIFSTGVLPSDPADAELRALPNARLSKPYRLAALKAALDAVNRKSPAP